VSEITSARTGPSGAACVLEARGRERCPDDGIAQRQLAPVAVDDRECAIVVAGGGDCGAGEEPAAAAMPPDDHGLDQIASAEDPREPDCLTIDALVGRARRDERGLEQQQQRSTAGRPQAERFRSNQRAAAT